MKRIVIVLLLAVGMTAAAQEQINLGLIPTPQKVELAKDGKVCVLAKAKIKEEKVQFGGGSWIMQIDKKQMYRLDIAPRKITILYEGEEGRQYAYLTLEQLKLLHDTIPCCTIHDWPAYKYRGWMDDISRGPVPHAAYRQKQYEVLHALKYNFSNYYTEHTLYQKEFPDLAPAYAADCRPLPDEVINLQLFAHAEKTLRVPYYQYMMDSKANFNPDNEATYDFLRKRIAAAYERIPTSPFFIINCDETEQLGTGRAKNLVDSLGADQVYVNHINRCYEIINQSYNQKARKTPPRVVMWGDIVAKNPEMMKQLPQDMTYIMWAYEPLDSYDHLIKPFKENGTPFWVAPSLSHSSNMIPCPQHYMKNIANLARDGYRNGAEGLMNTCWDDNGEALFDNCWHGLFWSAEMAWNPLKTDDPEELRQREAQFNENYERLFYGSTVPLSLHDSLMAAGDQWKRAICSLDTYLEVPEVVWKGIFHTYQLYEVGALAYCPDVADWYTSAALMEPLLNFNPDNISFDMLNRGEEAYAMAFNIVIDSARNPHVHYARNRILLTANKAILRYKIYQLFSRNENNNAYIQGIATDYLRRLFDLKREYLRLWDQENGDYERYIILNRYDALAREVLDLDRHVFMEVLPPNNQSTPMVQLRTLYDDRPIYYTLDGSEPTASSTKYEGPFPLERSATIRAISYNEYGEGVISEQYLLSHMGMGAKIKLNTPFSTYKSIYSGGGEDALIDGQLGSNATYADGHWQGYWGDSIDVVIDFGELKFLHNISMRFMQNTFDWILAPKEIRVYTSADGQEWTLAKRQEFDMDPRETGMRLKNYTIDLERHDLTEKEKRSAIDLSALVTRRYLRVVVPNPGPLPSWHPAPGQPSYLFIDEIVVK